MPAADYRLLVTPPAQSGLDRLPAAAAPPSSGSCPYRVLCSIDEPAGLVAVLRIDHRADVYRRR